MAREDFEERLKRLGVRADAQMSADGRVVAADPGPKRARPVHFLLGAFWGVAFGLLSVYLNQNYEALYHGEGPPPLWAVIALIFMLISLAVLAVMLVSGVIYALAGRFGARRWAVILTGLVFSAVGGKLARAMMAAGY